jgi:hypothetical protein
MNPTPSKSSLLPLIENSIQKMLRRFEAHLFHWILGLGDRWQQSKRQKSNKLLIFRKLLEVINKFVSNSLHEVLMELNIRCRCPLASK